MKVIINKKEMMVEDGLTIKALLVSQQLDKPGVAVAVDNRVVGRDQWESRVLNDGERLTVIKAVCGG